MEHLIAISASFHFFVQCALTDRTESELRINEPCNELNASLDDAHTKKKTNRLVRFSLCWCGLRFANGAIAPACVRTQHFVLHLLAMSTVLDFRKCCALAALFACGLPRLVASETSVIAKRGEFTRQSGVTTQTNSADALLCYAQTLRVDCFAMSASHGKCKCCALALSVARSQSDEVRVAHKCAVRLLSHANLG